MPTPPRRSSRSSKLLWQHQYEQFRARLVRGRELAKMTQHEAAEALGKSQSFVAKSETGERRVDIVELIAFARVYRKSLAWFAPGNRSRR